jgi:hypothetical protein
MEAASASETSVGFFQSTPRNTPTHTYRHENLNVHQHLFQFEF